MTSIECGQVRPIPSFCRLLTLHLRRLWPASFARFRRNGFTALDDLLALPFGADGLANGINTLLGHWMLFGPAFAHAFAQLLQLRCGIIVFVGHTIVKP